MFNLLLAFSLPSEFVNDGASFPGNHKESTYKENFRGDAHFSLSCMSFLGNYKENFLLYFKIDIYLFSTHHSPYLNQASSTSSHPSISDPSFSEGQANILNVCCQKRAICVVVHPYQFHSLPSSCTAIGGEAEIQCYCNVTGSSCSGAAIPLFPMHSHPR